MKKWGAGVKSGKARHQPGFIEAQFHFVSQFTN